MNWNDRIRLARVEKGWSQKKLADAAGVSQGHVSNIEKGKRGYTERSRSAIMEALGIGDDEGISGNAAAVEILSRQISRMQDHIERLYREIDRLRGDE